MIKLLAAARNGRASTIDDAPGARERGAECMK
jgi:hypothetical protein